MRDQNERRAGMAADTLQAQALVRSRTLLLTQPEATKNKAFLIRVTSVCIRGSSMFFAVPVLRGRGLVRGNVVRELVAAGAVGAEDEVDGVGVRGVKRRL